MQNNREYSDSSDDDVDQTSTSELSNSIRSNDDDTCAEDDAELRKLNLIQVYAKGNVSTKINENTMKSLTRAVRLVIIPKVKFLPGGRGFGSFDQPDFTHPKCWVNKVFDRIANLKNASDKKKAEVWMAYRCKIREQFSLHRSSVTLKLKNAFVKGKCISKGHQQTAL